MTVVGFRHSLLGVLGAGVFAAAPIVTVVAVQAITKSDEPVASLGQERAVMEEGLPLSLSLTGPGDRVVPLLVGGEVVGYRLLAGADSLALSIGLRNGDIVTRVNGLAMTSWEQGVEAVRRGQRDGVVVIDFLRDGVRGTLTHAFPASPVPSRAAHASSAPPPPDLRGFGPHPH